MPALIVAAAASETEEALGEWEPSCPGRGSGGLPLVRSCVPDGERDGGKEFKSGILTEFSVSIKTGSLLIDCLLGTSVKKRATESVPSRLG